MRTTTSTLILLFLLQAITASSQSLSEGDDHMRPELSGKSMTVLIAILVTAFFFMGFCSVYLHHCGNSSGNSTHDPSTAAAAARPNGGRSRSRRSRGLDPLIVSSFPTLLYSDVKHHKIGKHSLECSVCLSDFDDDDTLRLIPHCSHAFHPDCIDEWLSSHTTCPVCRHNLNLPPPPPQSEEPHPPEETHEVAVTIPPPVASTADGEEEGGGSVRSKVRALWRSRTTAGRMQQQQWGEEERERFTLRLPEHVRKEVMAGKLRRSATVAVGERRGSGRSMKLRRESGPPGRSDRWGFLTRGLSLKFVRGVAGGREGGDGSSKGKAVVGTSSSVISPRDCFSGGLVKSGSVGGSVGASGVDRLARV